MLCTSCFWMCSLHHCALKNLCYFTCPLAETGIKEIICKCSVNTGNLFVPDQFTMVEYLPTVVLFSGSCRSHLTLLTTLIPLKQSTILNNTDIIFLFCFLHFFPSSYNPQGARSGVPETKGMALAFVRCDCLSPDRSVWSSSKGSSKHRKG